jgi:TnpA family transposase
MSIAVHAIKCNIAKQEFREDMYRLFDGLKDIESGTKEDLVRSFWGDGSTFSSDGMRVQAGVSSLHAEHYPHYGSGRGTTMYRFVSDQYSTFYARIINTDTRDAVHVIDGLLYHETDLDI